MPDFSPINAAYAATTAESLISNLRTQIIGPIITLFLFVSTVVFIWGVIEMIRGADNEEERTKGKQHIVWGLLGLFIMVAAGSIIRLACKFFGADCG